MRTRKKVTDNPVNVKKSPIKVLSIQELVMTRSRKLQDRTRTRLYESQHPEHLLLSPDNAQKRVVIDSFLRQPLFVKKIIKGSLIKLLGRKKKNKFAIKADSQEEINCITEHMTEQRASPFFIRKSGLIERTPDPQGRERAWGPERTPYVEMLRAQGSHVLFKSESPLETRHRSASIDIKSELSVNLKHNFFLKKKKDPYFNFVVTAKGLKERRRKKRGCSQKVAAGGYSAADVFRALGVQFGKRIGRYFHLAHRIGWGLGGPQVKENLDPATAGSNYTTLFVIEDIIRFLLTEKQVFEIRMEGHIEYHPIHKKLPETITYTWFWGDGCSMTRAISSLSSRMPTRQENLEARAFASAIHDRFYRQSVLNDSTVVCSVPFAPKHSPAFFHRKALDERPDYSSPKKRQRFSF